MSPEEVSAIAAPPALDTVTLDHSRSNGVGRLVGTLAAILLFLSLNMFGSLVLTGVVEEKTTSVVEILLAHVRAHVLLAGKVLGIGLIALAQFSLLVVAGVVSLRISGITVPGEVWVALPATHRLVRRRVRLLRHVVRAGRLVRLPPGGRPIVGRAGVVDLHRRLPRRLHRRRRPGFDGGDGAVDPSAVRPAADAAAHRHRSRPGVAGGPRRGAARGRGVGRSSDSPARSTPARCCTAAAASPGARPCACAPPRRSGHSGRSPVASLVVPWSL